MVIPICPGYNAQSYDFNGVKNFGNLTKPLSVVNYLAYTYLSYIDDSCRLFAAISHFMTFESAVQNQNRFT